MEIYEILKYTLPSIIVFLTAIFTIRYFMKNDQQKKNVELVMNNQKLITPIRLQAYERITLFLERITPDSLLLRVMNHKMNCRQLQNELLSAIRSEFEHNLSQQIYLSAKSWEVIKSAKENIVQIIYSASTQVKPNDPAIKLSKTIIEKMVELKKAPTHTAIEYLKTEVKIFM